MSQSSDLLLEAAAKMRANSPDHFRAMVANWLEAESTRNDAASWDFVDDCARYDYPRSAAHFVAREVLGDGTDEETSLEEPIDANCKCDNRPDPTPSGWMHAEICPVRPNIRESVLRLRWAEPEVSHLWRDGDFIAVRIDGGLHTFTRRDRNWFDPDGKFHGFADAVIPHLAVELVNDDSICRHAPAHSCYRCAARGEPASIDPSNPGRDGRQFH